MKTKQIFTLILSITLIACTNGFEELNTSPTSSSYMDPGILFAGVQRDGNFLQSHEYRNVTVGSWIQHWNSGFNLPASRYIFQPGDWSPIYSEIRDIAQIRHHLLKGLEDNPQGRTKLAMAKIVEIDLWQDLTDIFGDVPFTESALGPENVISQPKYDKQEFIYKQLIQDIDAAMSNLTEGDASYDKYDLYYSGNVEKWKKYANAIKLQLGMRIKYVDPVLSKSTVVSALNGPLFTGNSDNAMIRTFNNISSSYNPILGHFTGGSPDLKYLGETLVKKLVESNDPRLPFIADPTVNSVKAGNPQYVGKAVALTDEQMVGVINDDYSLASKLTYFNLGIANPIPWYVFTYSEVCFYKAEAALEGWAYTVEDAEKFYQEGIKAAMALQPYNITAIPQDFMNKEFYFTGLTKEQKLEKIQTQKWILMFGRNYDAFAEWRRTGYPKLIPGPNSGSTNGQIPRRYGYPSDETLLNKENYDEAVSRMNHGDSYMSRVWWDVQGS